MISSDKSIVGGTILLGTQSKKIATPRIMMTDTSSIDDGNHTTTINDHRQNDSPQQRASVSKATALRDIPNGKNNNKSSNNNNISAMDVVLSDYQKQRLENIQRNNARLRSLGLLSSIEEERSNRLAIASETGVRASVPDVRTVQDGDYYAAATKSKRKRRNVRPATENRQGPLIGGSRKSRRLQGIAAASIDANQSFLQVDDNNADSNNYDDDDDDDKDQRWKKERKAIVDECRDVRLRTANAVAELGGDAAAKANPTATYDHCLMRVRSMTEKALANRVKVIERAAGTHCIVKMAIFKCCLQDEEKWDLASLASDALERLKALKPIPTN
jgi:hypothetical protein